MTFPQHLQRELDAMSALGLTVYPVVSQAKRLHVVAKLDPRKLKPSLGAMINETGFKHATFRDTDLARQWERTLTELFRFALGGVSEVAVHVDEEKRKPFHGLCFSRARRATADAVIRDDMRACMRHAMDAVDSPRVKPNVPIFHSGARCFDPAKSERVSWDAWHKILYDASVHDSSPEAAQAKKGLHGRVGFDRFPPRKRKVYMAGAGC